MRGKNTNRSHHPDYGVWSEIRRRCFSVKCHAYKWYGGRGIKMCPEWQKSFESFLHDMGPRPSNKYSIERVDNRGIKEIQPAHYQGKSYRDLALRTLPLCCNRCSYDMHHATLVVHHKDYDRSNNLLENLEILCANCHAIEHWSQ
jgi:hypothetical protein